MAQSIKKKYDHIIIGTGQAVGVLLKELISTGEKIAVVEGNKVGGSCVNYGCTPTKTLVASAEAIHKCRQGDEYGFSLGQLNVDYGRIRERMNDLRNESNNGLTEWMETTENVDLIRGYAKFTDKKCIEVEGEIFEGERIYINAGTHPFLPPIDGIEEVPWMDSEKLLEIEHLPRYLIIVGGGYVGVEFAQIYRRFGCDVTLIQSGDQLLKGEDEDIADSIKEILEDEAIQIHLNARARKVTGSEGSISVEMEAKGMTETVEGSHLLIATGRRANSKKLELENAGVNTDGRGNIEVDDYCRTNKAGVFALGDINGKGGFTHTAVHDAQVLVDHLYGQGERKISDRN
ncbi:MAG TPA: FAD-dependent oxidoreductase, partial [Cryomorphaceae bacterium]|nr:FAD-dependent oxidoreductase [Cryomorphaceae bacterium]